VTSRSRALVLINPNNPTGAVYPRAVVERLVSIAEERRLILFADEIYNRVLYDGAQHVPAGSVCRETLCATFNGLSKVYRACGFRTGWVVFSGRKAEAKEYLTALELLASLRLCSNVPGQWAVQTALGGIQSIYDLTSPTGRLGRQRRALVDAVARSPYLELVKPMGALYAFVGIKAGAVPSFTDTDFAMQLLERKQVLVVPGSSFNVDYADHFRVTLLPDEETLTDVFTRIDALLDTWPSS
jgi:alanine-synthesizing transaminase